METGRESSLAEPDERNHLAEARTDLAEDRTILANERTFAGWMRTGMAAVGIGLGFNALFQTLEPPWVPKAIATLILLIGVFIFWIAEDRACAVMSRMHAHEIKKMKLINLRLISWALILATLALIGAVWFLA